MPGEHCNPHPADPLSAHLLPVPPQRPRSCWPLSGRSAGAGRLGLQPALRPAVQDRGHSRCSRILAYPAWRAGCAWQLCQLALLRSPGRPHAASPGVGAGAAILALPSAVALLNREADQPVPKSLIAAKSTRRDNVTLAIAVILATNLALSLGDAAIKQVSASFVLWQIFVIRSTIAIPIVILIIRLRFRETSLLPRRPGWVALRSL